MSPHHKKKSTTTSYNFSKKGSLNLSIEAIVVMVIAFVVLGLGLGFVRGLFDEGTGTFEIIQDQVKQQILDDLRTGDKKLSFPATEITIGKRESKVTAIGIKNVKQGSLKYQIEIQGAGGEDKIIFGEDLSNNFLYETGVGDLEPTETRVIPVRITSETLAGTGQFKIIIKDVTSSTTYDTKTFFITVVG